MKIGVVLNSEKRRDRDFHYSLSILHSFSEEKKDDEYVIFAESNNPSIQYVPQGWNIVQLDTSFLTNDNDRKPYLSSDGLDLGRSDINIRAQHFFIQQHIDVLLYPFPNPLSFECGIPYIMTIHDVHHRQQPHFPEVSAGMNWHNSEYLFRNAVRHAHGIIASSEMVKEDILNFYRQYITPEKIYTLPVILSPLYNSFDISEENKAIIKKKHNLPDRFFFYPAQFWMHKNHSRLVHAIHILRFKYHTDIPLILCGSRSAKSPDEACELIYRNSMFLAQQLGVPDLVYYIGHVPEEEIPLLYATAHGLVMPSLLSSTNYPVVEAWGFACPVVSSDIRGIREQVGDAGILVNPADPHAIAQGLLSLWNDETFRLALIQKGRQKLVELNYTNFATRLKGIIADVRRQLL
jgi:glycosyltransferase involved in cell wall biosynthesis